jgi:hypothetical protein
MRHSLAVATILALMLGGSAYADTVAAVAVARSCGIIARLLRRPSARRVQWFAITALAVRSSDTPRLRWFAIIARGVLQARTYA